jgi:hypothetical protein
VEIKSCSRCDKAVWARGLCKRHYNLARNHDEFGGPRCEDSDGCERRATARGLCPFHYQRAYKAGRLPDLKNRPMGTGNLTPEGYVRVVVDGERGHEHRFVMERMIGRPLRPDETVHHRNGINHDNREENLELWLAGHGRGQRVTELVEYLRELGFTVSGGPANY